MKKFTLMLALAVFSMAANALTVFYNNTISNWAKVCAYAYSPTETLGTWPGTEMTAVADHDGWFSIEVDESQSKCIIFNNSVGGGSGQTGDLTLNADKPYYNDGWTFSFDGEVIVEIYTVYYKNVNNWETVNAYAWGGAAVTAGWPGDRMTAVAEHDGWYSVEFKGGLPANIIFNNGSQKTGDLTIDSDNLYYNNGWTNSFDGEVVIVLPEKMYLKHPFENGAWEWRELAKQEDGTFARKDYWQGGGANVNTTDNDNGAKWFPADQITGAPANTGVLVTYAYNYAASALSIVLDETPSVMLTVPERAIVGEEVTFSATALNMENPVYTYSVKAPEATGFVLLEGAAYTPAAEGVYTVKVNAAGEGGATAEDTKELTVTAPVQITGDFYLVGYINGADYGCEADADNVGEYKFVDGTLVATFTHDSYVFVKTGDNKNWFMSKGYAAESPATLYNTNDGGNNKLFVPGNKEITFTLVANTNGTLTLSYVTGAPVKPDYYLVGNINGADYGCDADYENLGEYKFVDGRLSAIFTQTSYVFVKTSDNKNWYMSAAYVEPAETVSATLGIAGETVSEKIGVPANFPIDFTLVENADGTLTLSYVAKGYSTALENAVAGYALTLNNGMLSVTADAVAAISLYTVNGQLLDAQQTAGYCRQLTAGIYLLRINNTTEKLVVF